MKTTSFTLGQRLIFNNLYYQIKNLFHDSLTLQNLSDQSKIEFSRAEFIKLIESGVVAVIADQIRTAEPTIDLVEVVSSNQLDIVLKRYEYVKAVDEIYPSPRRSGLESLIMAVSQKLKDNTPPSNITLYRWWRRWLSSGKKLKSLEDKIGGRKGYRQYKNTVKDIFYEVVGDVYLTRERQSKQEVYLTMRSQINHYNHTMRTSLQCPSRATIYRMLQDLDDYTVTAERYGQKEADRKYRISGKGVSTLYPLERTEIDHTPLDIIVLDDKTGLPAGRPFLTCILDSHTRMPLALSIGFEPPSELSVIRALQQAVWPKDHIVEGISDIQGQWPSYGIPSLLVCDNGLEFHSEHLRRVCGELNIELMFCPKHKPYYKGRVERFLGTLNRQVSQRIKGTTFSNIMERGEYNSAEEAVITLSELQEIVYLWAIDIYMQAEHRTLGVSPYKKWTDDIQRIVPNLPTSKGEFDLICAKEYKRSLSHEGLRFKRLTYNSEQLRTMRIIYGNNAEVSFRVNPENIEKLWVYDSNEDSFFEVPCTDQEYAKNLTLFQHLMILRERLTQQKNDLEKTETDLMSAKELLGTKIKKLSSDKRLKKRSKALRIGVVDTINRKNVEQDHRPKQKSNNSFQLEDIPDFEILPLKIEGEE